MGHPNCSSEPVVEECVEKHKSVMKIPTTSANESDLNLDLLNEARRSGRYALVKGRSRASSKESWHFVKVTGVDLSTGKVKIVEFKTLSIARISAVRLLEASSRRKRGAAASSDLMEVLK